MQMATKSSRHDQMAAVEPFFSCNLVSTLWVWYTVTASLGRGAYNKNHSHTQDRSYHDEDACSEEDDEANLSLHGCLDWEDDRRWDDHDAYVGDKVHDQRGQHVDHSLWLAIIWSLVLATAPFMITTE